jgi:cell division protein FtsB
MLKRNSQRANPGFQEQLHPTAVLPPSPLFAPPSASDAVFSSLQPGPADDLPTKRAVWRIVLTAVVSTVVLLSLIVGGFLVYRTMTDEISALKSDRTQLQRTNAALTHENSTLSGDLAQKRVTLRKTNAKLAKTWKGLVAARKSVTGLRKDVEAANARATANYGAGFSAGTSEGYSSGHTDGIVQGSDELVCSDDPDVTWLPFCNY